MNKQEKITEIMKITNPGVAVSKTMTMTLESVLSEIPGAPEILDKVLLEAIPTLTSRIASAYALLYSEDEVGAMYDYYTSPAGRAISAKAITLLPIMMQVGEEWGAEVAELVKVQLDLL